MARNILKRFFPSPAAIKSHPALHFLGDLLHDPNLFHLNRHSVSVAFFWGLFIALLPIPGQMVVAAFAALVFRCNLPITVALVWITNPLTMPFFFYITYQVGRIILQTEPLIIHPELTWSWLTTELGLLWKPFLAGSVLSGLIIGTLGYFGMQFFWRWHVIRSWETRKKRALKKKLKAFELNILKQESEYQERTETENTNTRDSTTSHTESDNTEPKRPTE